MPAIDFKDRFAHLVAIGDKRQTVRRRRKCPIRPNQKLIFYSGRRQKKGQRAQKLGEAICLSVNSIFIDQYLLVIDGEKNTIVEREAFALRDGCQSWAELVDLIDSMYRLPFEGVVILW